jgi:hypothetical protein
MAILNPVTVARTALQVAGFDLARYRFLPAGSFTVGFSLAHTGGGCMAMRKECGPFYMVLTSESGDDVPDPEGWDSNLVGVYRQADDAVIVCVSASEWKQVVEVAQ